MQYVGIFASCFIQEKFFAFSFFSVLQLTPLSIINTRFAAVFMCRKSDRSKNCLYVCVRYLRVILFNNLFENATIVRCLCIFLPKYLIGNIAIFMLLL